MCELTDAEFAGGIGSIPRLGAVLIGDTFDLRRTVTAGGVRRLIALFENDCEHNARHNKDSEHQCPAGGAAAVVLQFRTALLTDFRIRRRMQ